MLPKNLIRAVALLLVLLIPLQGFVYAGDFENAVQDGHDLANTNMQSYTPGTNLSNTLQNKVGTGTTATTIAPFSNDANQALQNKTYNHFYTTPGDMNAPQYNDPQNNEIYSFIKNSSDTRTHYDLSRDPTFGNKCLQTDPSTGQCSMWSTGQQDIVTGTYTDCTKVIVPSNPGSTYTEQTCSGTSGTATTPCQLKTVVNVDDQDVYTPCAQYTPTPTPGSGQIYEACVDFYTYWKGSTPMTQTLTNDCNCCNNEYALCADPHGKWYWRNSDSHYNILCSSIPQTQSTNPMPGDAFSIGTSFENFRNRQQQDGWDKCTSDQYTWYARYDHSVIETVTLGNDTPCGQNLTTWASQCGVSNLTLCDPSGANCIISIQDGVPTGNIPSTTYLTKVHQGIINSNCSSCGVDSCDDSGICSYSCPDSCNGECSSAATLVTTPSGSAIKVGDLRLATTNQCGSGSPVAHYDEFFYYQDPRVCNSVVGQLNNYLICLKYDSIDLDDGSGLTTLTSTPIRNDSAQDLYNGHVTITKFALFGGPDVRPFLNSWNATTTFSCFNETDNCQSLRDQGCVLYSSSCTDSTCAQAQFVYHCGINTSQQTVTPAYNCNGDLRCMGADCKDVSYLANNDFGTAAATTEVLNQYRADATPNGTDIAIFPGEEQDCHDSPHDCCKTAQMSGATIGSYVMAARSAYTLYAAASTGFAATQASMAVSLSSVLGGSASGGLSTLVGTQTSNIASITLQSGMNQTFSLGVNTTLSGASFDTMAQAGQQIGVNVATSGAESATATGVTDTISTIASVASVVTIALAVYSVISLIYDIVFACTKDDILTDYKKGMRLCHHVGERCDSSAMGLCLDHKQVYCCFNSILARLLHEQGRPQINMGWGDGNSPQCGGFTAGQLGAIDFSKINFDEYMQYVLHKTSITIDEQNQILSDIQKKLATNP